MTKTNELKGSKYYELFKHMKDEHNLILLDSEMAEIIDKVAEVKNKDISIAKKVLLYELEEQMHPVPVEDVIFWALEFYAENKKGEIWGKTIANTIKARILEKEKKQES